jgi:hypothetical protein
MNARQNKHVQDAAALTSEALDRLRAIEERQALANQPRLVRELGRSTDHERDHWRQRIVWQATALWCEDPALIVPAIRAVMALKPEQSRWRLHKLCELWAQVGGPDWPVLGPVNGPWRASLEGVSQSAA